MNGLQTWWLAAATFALLALYELVGVMAQRQQPERLARSAHATLRETWFDAVSLQSGSEILAVQTLRNSVMSATMTASTAALALMGMVSLTAPSLQDRFIVSEAARLVFSVQLALELVLLALLFASLVACVSAVRYYNHVGFIMGMPVESDARKRWAEAGRRYVRRAGLLYSWGLRYLIMTGPILASMLSPLAGPVAAVIVVSLLLWFDRAGPQEYEPLLHRTKLDKP